MRIIKVLLIILLVYSKVFAQISPNPKLRDIEYDLITRLNNQTIECKIVSISNSEIVFTIKMKSYKVNTSISIEDVKTVSLSYFHHAKISDDLTEINRLKIVDNSPPKVKVYRNDVITRSNNQTIDCKVISISNKEISFSFTKNRTKISTTIYQEDVVKIGIINSKEVRIDEDLTDENRNKIEYFPIDSSIITHQKIRRSFIGLNFTSIMINGKGEMAGSKINATDYLFDMNLSSMSYKFKLFTGWGWNNKWQIGFQPLAGYNITPEFKVVAMMSFYNSKSSNATFSHAYPYSPLVVLKAEMKFSRRSILVMNEYHPKELKGLYLMYGFESVKIKYSSSYNLKVANINNGSLSLSGDDKAYGFFLGFGFEKSIFYKNLRISGSVTKSFIKYSGYELFKIDNSYGMFETLDKYIPGKMNIGGTNISLGIRQYF